MNVMNGRSQLAGPIGMDRGEPVMPVPADKAPEIPQLLIQLNEWLNDLHAELGLLEDRLKPIVVPVPERTSDGRDEAAAGSGVGMALSDDLRMIKAAVGRARALRMQLAI